VKAVILAGGQGSRLSEETIARPKPMVDIGGRPILWHIMKGYAVHGVQEFIICLGYKGYMIKEYFAQYALHHSDVTFDLGRHETEIHSVRAEPWIVTLVDTGLETNTGGRLKRVMRYLREESEFCLTYGDGVSDLDITRQLDFHRKHGRLATVTGVRPIGRFGSLEVDGDRVTAFAEKPDADDAWINGGFFILSPRIEDLLESDNTIWEGDPLQELALKDELRVFKHRGFWHPMDTMRDRHVLESLWNSGRAPWRTWA
jgi:glucose-1-phosphate cytidylyltransferase